MTPYVKQEDTIDRILSAQTKSDKQSKSDKSSGR